MNRTLVICLSAILFLFAPAFADEVPRIALNILSMIPGDQNRCVVSLNGKKIHPEGLVVGVETGWFSMSGDKLELSAEHPDGERLEEPLEADGSAARIIVIYLQAGENAEETPPVIQIAVFPAFTAGTQTRKLVSLCENEETFLIGEAEAKLKPLTPVDAPLWEPAGFTVSHQGKDVGKIGEVAKELSCYLFVSKGRDGTHHAAVANADQLEAGR